MKQFHVANASACRRAVARLVLVALSAAPFLAQAQVPDKPVQVINALAAMGVAMGAGLLTIFGMVFFSKMGSGRAHWAEGSNLMWAGVGMGCLAALVTYFLS